MGRVWPSLIVSCAPPMGFCSSSGFTRGCARFGSCGTLEIWVGIIIVYLGIYELGFWEGSMDEPSIDVACIGVPPDGFWRRRLGLDYVLR